MSWSIADELPVDILLPVNWRDPPRFRLHEAIEVCGVLIHAGFITDGASVPRYLWPLFPPIGRYFRAAAVHDYLLDSGTPWKAANRVFKQALIHSNIPRWRRVMMVAAVRFHGWYKVNFTDDVRGFK